ncbi:MAG: oligosaccharide flippase family protein [Gammaproteobacteria bacterium]
MASLGKGKILRNLYSLSIGKLAADLAAFGLFVVISRQFGEEGVGQYSFAMALTGFLMVYADFGLEFLSTRDLSRLPHKELAAYMGRVVAVRIFQTLVTVGTLGILCSALPYSRDFIFVIFVVGLFQVLYTGVDGLAAVFIAREEMFTAAMLTATLRIMAALTAAALIILGVELGLSLIVFPVFTALQLGIAYRMVNRRIGSIRPYATFAEIKDMMREALPFAVSEFLRQLGTRTDVVALGLLIGAAAAGVYNAAFRIIFMLSLFSYLAGVAIFPGISRLFKNHPAQMCVLYSRYLGVAILVGIPASVGLALIADELILIIFGDALAASGRALEVLAVLVLFAAVKFMMQMFMMAGERQKLMVRSQWISATVCVVALLLLIPRFEVLGAAAAVITSEFILIVLYAKHLRSLVGLPRVGHRLFVAVTGALVVAAVVEYLQPLSIAAMIPLAVLVYCLIVLCSRDIRHNELKFFVESIRR